MKIVVFMPAYNASSTIESVFQRIHAEAFKKIDKFIIVDDGSTDNTAETIKKLMARYRIKLVQHDANQGYGAAQKTGWDECKKEGADIAVMLHSDGQYAPELLLEMIKPIEDGKADVVGGSRCLGGNMLDGGMPIYKYIGNMILTRLENTMFRANLHCYHSGYKAYSKKALEVINYNTYSDYYIFDSEMLVGALRNKLRIAEVPIPTRYAGEISRLDPIKYGIGILKVMWRYLKKEI